MEIRSPQVAIVGAVLGVEGKGILEGSSMNYSDFM